jgi:hypothetical protein
VRQPCNRNTRKSGASGNTDLPGKVVRQPCNRATRKSGASGMQQSYKEKWCVSHATELQGKVVSSGMQQSYQEKWCVSHATELLGKVVRHTYNNGAKGKWSMQHAPTNRIMGHRMLPRERCSSVAQRWFERCVWGRWRCVRWAEVRGVEWRRVELGSNLRNMMVRRGRQPSFTFSMRTLCQALSSPHSK